MDVRRWPIIIDLPHPSEVEPLRLALDHVFDNTFVWKMAAGSYHRDQTID